MPAPLTEDLRDQLRTRPSQAARYHRVLVVPRGSPRRTPNDLDLINTLHALGHTVFDLDVSAHPGTMEPTSQDASDESVGFNHQPVQAVFDRFAPQILLFCGSDLLPRTSTVTYLQQLGVSMVTVAAGSPPAAPGPVLVRRDTVTRATLLHQDGASDQSASELRLLEDEIERVFAEVRGSTPLAGHARPRVVIFSGYYGAENRGDELLLSTLVEHLSRTLPDVMPVVAAADPATVERTHGVQAFRRADLTMAEVYAARAHAMVLGPGGHWHDYSIAQAGGVAGMTRGARVSPAHMAQLPLLVAAYGGEVFVQGMGVGPLSDVAARAAVHLTGRLASRVTVRDQGSADLLLPESQAWSAEPEVTPDVVYSLDLPPVPANGDVTGHLVVNLRPWSDAPAVRQTMIETIVDCARQHGLRIVALPMQPTDVPPLQELIEVASQATVPVPAELLPSDAPLAEVIYLLDSSAGLVSMRLHASLLMHRRRRSALGLSYDPKVRAHFEQIHRGEAALDLDASADALRHALARVVDEPLLPEAAQRAVASLENESRADLAELARLLGRTPARVLDPMWIHHRPAPTTPEARPEPRDTWWPADQMLDISSARVQSGNTALPGRDVPVLRSTDSRGDCFSLADRAPRQGDQVTWSFEVPAVPGEGLRVELSLQQRYEEKVRYAGRLDYTVLVDGTELLVHDVATWTERQTVWIAARAAAPALRIEIRIEALRDCEDWGWGPSTALTVQRVRAPPWDARDPLVWGCSSPYATAVGPASGPAEAAPRPLWRRAASRLARRIRMVRSTHQS